MGHPELRLRHLIGEELGHKRQIFGSTTRCGSRANQSVYRRRQSLYQRQIRDPMRGEHRLAAHAMLRDYDEVEPHLP
jgi:hypothetical protein